jgi:hypothetical protein
MYNTGKPCGMPELNVLGSSFWLSKKNASFGSVVMESVQIIISLWDFCAFIILIRTLGLDLLKAHSKLCKVSDGLDLGIFFLVFCFVYFRRW